MVNITNDNFSIKQICQSGQCFRMQNTGEEGLYEVTAFGKYLRIRQEQNRISFDCTTEEFEQIWKIYFDLEENYGEIIASVDREDAYLTEAAAFGSGIRILRQDLWEMIVSFIISQQNNIKRIRKCIDALCRKYGEEKRLKDGVLFYTFPTPEKLASAALEDLYACNLGYRSRYIQKTAGVIAAGKIDLEALRKMDYAQAKEKLLLLYGVGEKVADCICLFGLHLLDAFPRDTHINKVMARQYPEGFPMERYQGHLGVLQQYIFYYDLNH